MHPRYPNSGGGLCENRVTLTIALALPCLDLLIYAPLDEDCE